MKILRWLSFVAVLIIAACHPQSLLDLNSPKIFSSEPDIQKLGAYYLVLVPERKDKRGSSKRFDKNLLDLNPGEFEFNQVDREDFAGDFVLQDLSSTLIKQKWPYAYNHGLLVPQISQKIPQRLSLAHLGVAHEFVQKESTRRIGYNSLMSGASVNHLHFHVFHTNKQMKNLAIEEAQRTHQAGELFVSIYYPINFIFSKNLNQVWQLTDFMQQNDHPFSLIISGEGIFVIPRKKNTNLWRQGNMWSFAEVAGMIPIFDSEVPAWLNEAMIKDHMNELSYSKEEILELVNKSII